jgi:hypothetical protein
MPKTCSPASVKTASAVYYNGHLIITAEGTKPTLCVEVSIQRSPLTIFPPQYIVQACVDPAVICPPVITPYRAVNIFASGPVDTIKLHTASGIQDVKVVKSDDPKGVAVTKGGGGGHLPSPLRLGRSLEGVIESFDGGEPREATGYSDSFSFDEAFREAVANLPPRQVSYPDEMTTVTVTSIGALFGGIVGFQKMFVKISAL